MGNNCLRVGSDDFICTEEQSCVHPVITVTQQSLVNAGIVSNLRGNPETQEHLRPRGLSQSLLHVFCVLYPLSPGMLPHHGVFNLTSRETRVLVETEGLGAILNLLLQNFQGRLWSLYMGVLTLHHFGKSWDLSSDPSRSQCL